MLYLSLAIAAVCPLTRGGLSGERLGMIWLATIALNYAFVLTRYQREQVLGLRPPVRTIKAALTSPAIVDSARG